MSFLSYKLKFDKSPYKFALKSITNNIITKRKIYMYEFLLMTQNLDFLKFISSVKMNFAQSVELNL